ncbi:MAG: sigma-70 family RNA polymerase sigma factor [Gammaproteobacteria bacterium]|nr:sigma-70 family RNA polymerase sigma factor [Gammaproteobacteria bacterium]
MTDWDGIVREYGPAVSRIASRILGVRADAEDVTQEVFCEAWQLQMSQPVANWAGLLRRLAVLRALDCRRRRRPETSLSRVDVGHDRDGPQQLAMARELAEGLRQAIAQLPDQQAAVFSLFYFEHLSRVEIAEALGTTVGAVSTSLSKARRTLKCALSGMLQETDT